MSGLSPAERKLLYGAGAVALAVLASDRQPGREVTREKAGLAPDDPRHGTPNGYNNFGCRCGPCRTAWNEYPARRRALDRWRVRRGISAPVETRRGTRAGAEPRASTEPEGERAL